MGKTKCSAGSNFSMSWWIATLDPESSTDKGLKMSPGIYYDPLMTPTCAGLRGHDGDLEYGPCPQAWIIAALKLETVQVSTRPEPIQQNNKSNEPKLGVLQSRGEAVREQRPWGKLPGDSRPSHGSGREGKP